MPPFADVLQWEHLPFPKSLRDFQRLFATDEACARYLEGAKWPKGFVCPHCEEKGEALFCMVHALCDLDEPEPFRLTWLIAALEAYAAKHGYDLWGAVAEKREYNRHRADHKPAARLAANGKKW